MPRNPDKAKFSKSERAALRELAAEAWKAELSAALIELHEEFGKWADDAIDAFELSDKIHKFHDGISRELYGLYTRLDAAMLVSRAVALRLVQKDALTEALAAKLAPQIQSIRESAEE
jgi:hypothetical protein